MVWFDGHLDLAYIHRQVHDIEEQDPTPFSVSFQNLADGRVAGCLATLFVMPGDLAVARREALAQATLYKRWREEGRICFLREDGFTTKSSISVGIAIENPDCISSPEDLVNWVRNAGVVSIGLAWNAETAFASGVRAEGGLKDAGRALIDAAKDLKVAIDISHLNTASTLDVLEYTSDPVIASHSNITSLLSPTLFDGEMAIKPDRHLSNDIVREIGRRRGLVGINLFQRALLTKKQKRANLSSFAAHYNSVIDLTQSVDCVGLGSDMDGGIKATDLCDPIRNHADLQQLSDELFRQGRPADVIDKLKYRNWLRVLKLIGCCDCYEDAD